MKIRTRALPAWTLLLGLLLGLGGSLPVAVLAQTDGDGGDGGLQGALDNIGAEYAKSYLAPMIHTFGVNQNSGLYTTAAIPKARLTFSFGVKFMDTRIDEADESFRRVLNDVTLNETWGVSSNPADPNYSPYYGEQGTVVMVGPTCFGPDGDENEGAIEAYHDGVLVGRTSTVAGLVKTRDVPLAMPEISVGGFYGVRATVRWLPAISAGDEVGDIKLFGWGLQGNVNQFFPVMPVDVMVGFFHQALHVGDIVDTDATSVFLAASKSYGLVTGYGGFAKESSNFKVNYTFTPLDITNAEPTRVSFEVEGRQSSRFTLGVAFNLGVKLNADVNFGSDLTTYSAGLMFGI